MSSLIHIERLKFHLVFNSQQRQWQRQRRWQQQQLKNSSCTNRWMKNRIKMPKKDVHGTSTPGSHVSCLRSISLNAVYTVHILNDWRMHVKQHIKCLLNKIDLLSFAASLFFSFFSLFFFLKTKQNKTNLSTVKHLCACTRCKQTCVTPCAIYTDWSDIERSMHFRNMYACVCSVHIFFSLSTNVQDFGANRWWNESWSMCLGV